MKAATAKDIFLFIYLLKILCSQAVQSAFEFPASIKVGNVIAAKKIAQPIKAKIDCFGVTAIIIDEAIKTLAKAKAKYRIFDVLFIFQLLHFYRYYDFH